ncbi:MAG TPA: SbcC/MukB-like Walker B domain-containing protein, partial [Erysipelothrix sp.]|nr:SbcC/MukB-like Walker B domain-containing protein [Erysipelothrix sp.]
HKLYLKDQEMISKLNIDLETLNDDLAILRDEVSSGLRKIDRLETSVSNIEAQLVQKGYEDIKKRLEEIDKSLELKLTQEKINLGNIGSLKTKMDELTRILQELKVHFDAQVLLHEEAKRIYHEEFDLGYVSDIKNPRELMKHIQSTAPNLKSFSDLSFELQDAIHNNRASLQEYNLTRYNIFSDNEAATRLDISARYAGETINIKTLNETLAKAIEEQKLLLEEKDRELIEEILINTISKKIRNRIQHSKAWVKRINRYMDSMNTSSGLKLSLNWQSKRGETEDELNSEKLVSLMERDVRLLRDEDKKALSKHFESKINLARKRAELEETHESFHQIMSQIMDFRTWFSFKIMVQKQGETKRELTNNIFNTYSGGEKAMSMYIPLFSALAAKYEGGNKDAPHIIALDEAFAGVDENNIGNMFELIRNFKFDYIMNSQVLWGDYPSVKSLAIYELFRPENVPYVTIVGYEWNGTTKRMVT